MIKKKTKIVIASILKPVDDVRNYEKLGYTLSKSDQYDVILMGTQTDEPHENKVIAFHSWNPFKRLSIDRLKIQFSFLKAILNHKPDLVIITTHELIFVSVFAKLITSFKLVYDVQEDYYLNLKHQNFYPALIRYPAAYLIRSIEWLSRPFIHHYLLAEEVYSKNLVFAKGKATIIDNKSLPIINTPCADSFNFVFTGTITDYSKAVESVQLYSTIKQHFVNPKMIVIGHCPSATYLKKLRDLAHNDSSIILQIQDHPVPHNEIVAQIEKANLAIIGYQTNPVNQYKVPTKQYEYTAARLPYLVRANTHWSKLGTELQGAIPIDFNDPQPEEIVRKLNIMDKDYIKSDLALWENNEVLLLNLINNVIQQ